MRGASLQFFLQPIFFVFWFALALIGDHACGCGYDTGGASATARFFSRLKEFLFAYLHGDGSSEVFLMLSL